MTGFSRFKGHKKHIRHIKHKRRVARKTLTRLSFVAKCAFVLYVALFVASFLIPNRGPFPEKLFCGM